LTSRSAYSTLTSLQRKRYLFVCINRRAEDNPKGCCAAKNSEEVYRALKEDVAARGLAKLEARVCTSSCLDQCETGVTVLVEPDHFFYGRVTVAEVEELVEPGELDPDHVHTPALYVDRIVVAPREKRIERRTVRAA